MSIESLIQNHQVSFAVDLETSFVITVIDEVSLIDR